MPIIRAAMTRDLVSISEHALHAMQFNTTKTFDLQKLLLYFIQVRYICM